MNTREVLRALPKVDRLAGAPELSSFAGPLRTEAARRAIGAMRNVALAGETVTYERCLERATSEANLLATSSLRRVVNLSGVVMHTGLGRSRLAPAAVQAIADAAGSYISLEFDLESGRRGDRQEHVRSQICALTGAEDALVVNNAAGAVLLALSALSSGREVVLSRGQMVEIGGSFRLPEIVVQSGCRLVEVGCTNKTHLSDYRRAIGPDTSAILRCHPSNYAILGFHEEVPPSDLATLAKEHGVLLIDDQGSGLVVDVSRFGMPSQPTVQDSIRAGADVVTASCDKLLGGPQAGMILGRHALIAAIAAHPLARTLRIDKLSLAALEATLRIYREGREEELPVFRYLARPIGEVAERANRLQWAWAGESIVEDGITEVGSGAAPGTGVPTKRLGIVVDKPQELLAELRSRPIPIVGRIEKGKLWLDPRTAEDDELSVAEGALREISQ